MVLEGSASAFYHSRRNREYPSFSSALLEEILRSTESCTVEDEKINRPKQDSSIGLPVCMEPSRGEGGIEIGILEALKYFHGHVDNNNNDNHGSNQATEVDKKKMKVSALQSRRAPEADSTKRFMGRAAADGLVCQQSQSNVGRHGSTRGNKDASSSSSSHGVAQLEQTRTKQPMSPGIRLANFLNSLFVSMGMGKRKSKRDGHDHDHPSEKSPVIKRNWKYKYGDKEKEKLAAGQLKSVSVCSMSSMTASTDCTSTVSTTSSSNSSRLHHYKSVTSTSSCTSTASTISSSNSSRQHHYKSNPCNVSKNEHSMKRYDEFSSIDHACSCHDPKLFNSSSFVNNNPSPKNGSQRSVKFYPTTAVRSDEYALSCGKNLNRMEIHNKQSLPFPSKRLRPVQSIKKGMIPSEYLRYHQDLKYSKKLVQLREDEYGDSDSSSDLFELQNLNAVGMDIYSRELPVYETTNLETNRAIAKGLL